MFSAPSEWLISLRFLSWSQTMSTVTLNFRENLELKNNCTYMKYLVLIKNNWKDF